MREGTVDRVATAAIRAALRGNDPSQEQWAAIEAPLGPQWIVAGAGSGKTAVMTARIVYLVERGMVRPSCVLGLTFTNKAARELEERLTAALDRMDPHPRESPTVMTYHAFAQQLVREHGPRLGIDSEAQLLTEAQKWQMLMDLVDDLPKLEALELRHPLSFIPQTLALAGQCADHLVTPEELEAECDRLLGVLGEKRMLEATRKRKDLCVILRAYLEAKRRARRIDYGDQITLAVRLLETFPDLRRELRERFRVVLLDEYQDTNPAQRRMLQLLCPPGSAVTAVGDARQAIYAWRGASMYNLIRFAEDFPAADGSTYPYTSLAENWRSGRRIVELANRIIRPVPPERRPGAELVPVPSRGEGQVRAALFAHEEAEAAWIAEEIERLHRDGTPWREVAVLLRRRRYMDHVVRALEARDIPFEVPELGGLLKVPPVVDLVAWLRVLADPGPATNRWVARILLGPRFRVHYGDLAPIARWAAARTSELRAEAASLREEEEPDPGEVAFSLLEALEHAEDIEGVSQEARARIREFLDLRDELRRLASRPLMELAQAVAERTGIADTLAASPSRSAQAMARHVQTFLGVCGDFAPLEGEATLEAFLDYLDAAEESDDAIPLAATAPSDSVKVMTVHSAKGLEFEAVFVPALAAQQECGKDGWRLRSVFPDVRASDPEASAQALPNTVRQDRAHLPDPKDFPNRTAYVRELKRRAEEDERRLFYVALTRARRTLSCTAAWWYRSEEQAKGPSVFFEEVAAQRDLVELVREDPRPEHNPLLERLASELRWPPDPRLGADAVGWVERVEALVDGRLTTEEVLALGGGQARALLEQHLQALEVLLAASREPASPPARPRSLSATDAVRIALGKEPAGPIPTVLIQPATQARRLGIEVHAWIEERGRGLLGLAEEEALDEPSPPPPKEEVERLRRAWVAMGFDRRELAVLDSGEAMAELPFTLKVGDRLVRGRIDAVYRGPDGLEVVDFKTGAVPPEPDWGQLELYAEALAALGLAEGPVTLTYAYLSEERAFSKPYAPRGLGWLEEGLRAAGVLDTP